MGDAVRFDIKPLNRFAGTNATIKRPVEIAHFSYDENRNFHLDESSLRYYFPPDLGVNLSDGFDRFRKLDETDEHLDGLLRTLVDLEKREGKTGSADIVTWRGMITKIMTAPFDNMNGFDMNAVVYQGTIYIEEDFPARVAKQREERARMPSHPSTGHSQELMAYWGYKFETLATLPHSWHECTREQIEKRNEHVVDNYAQYCSVAKTAIGGVELILGGEVDAIWDSRPDDKEAPINWVELKTSAAFNPHQARGFERKLLKFWAQSFLLGVPKIIVGFRDDNGVLLQLQEFQTHAIPGAVKRGQGTWDGNICINFLAEFLRFLKEILTDDGMWHIARRPQQGHIEVFKVKDRKTSTFLSEEFLAWRQQALAQSVADMLT